MYLEVREVGVREDGIAVLRCAGIADLITDFNSTIQPHPDTMG